MSHVTRSKAAIPPLRSSALAAAVALLAGCSDDPLSVQRPGDEAPSASRGVSQRGAPRPPGGPMGLDRTFYDMGGRVPGFAGFYVDGDGTVNVMLVDRKQNGLARREVSEFLGRSPGRKLGHMKIVQAKYDFRQLHGWKERIAGPDAQAALTGIGICEDQNRLCIGAYRGGGLGVLRNLLARLGIPEDAVSIREQDPAAPRKLLTDTFKPVPAGVLVDDVCTLGFNALFGTTRVFVTNTHCTLQWADADPPDVFGQPDDGVRKIGVETFDPTSFTCSHGPACRYSDAAEITYYDSVTFRLGKIARPYFGTITVDPNNPEFTIIGEVAVPHMGQTLSFVGITSGWQEGQVDLTCQDRKYTADWREVWLLCQDRFTAPGAGGDSGGPVFERVAGGVYLAGILWGGDTPNDTFFSAMTNIENSDNFGDYQTSP